MRAKGIQILFSLYTMATVVSKRHSTALREMTLDLLVTTGGTVAKFAGQNVHKRLLTEESYHQKNYETAMKRAFLGTDEDLLASEWQKQVFCSVLLTTLFGRPGTYQRSFGLYSCGRINNYGW